MAVLFCFVFTVSSLNSQPWWLGRGGGIQCFCLLLKCTAASCHKRCRWKGKYTLGTRTNVASCASSTWGQFWVPVVVVRHSVVSESLQPHGLQHARLPCPSPAPRACSNSCPLSWWCHPTVSSSVIPFSSRLQSFPASGSFPVSQFFSSGGQSIGVSASASVLLMNTQDWSPLQRTDWLDLLAVQGTLKSLLQHHSSKVSILLRSVFFISPTLISIHDHWKNHSLH